MIAPKAIQVSGLDALKDTMQMLDGLTFDAVRGGGARTESLFLSVIPAWEDDTRETFRATLTCQAMWHREVDWQMMRVLARPQSSSGFFVQYLLPLSEAGRATFEGLESGTYVLRAYCPIAKFTAPPVGPGQTADGDLAAVGMGVGLAADAAADSESQPLGRNTSETEDIEVFIGKRGSFTVIEFATNTEEFAGKSIEFCVTNPQTKAVYRDAMIATFGTETAEGEYKYKTNATELSFDADVSVEVSYRLC